jgi:hypothetical protein
MTLYEILNRKYDVLQNEDDENYAVFLDEDEKLVCLQLVIDTFEEVQLPFDFEPVIDGDEFLIPGHYFGENEDKRFSLYTLETVKIPANRRKND